MTGVAAKSRKFWASKRGRVFLSVLQRSSCGSKSKSALLSMSYGLSEWRGLALKLLSPPVRDPSHLATDLNVCPGIPKFISQLHLKHAWHGANLTVPSSSGGASLIAHRLDFGWPKEKVELITRLGRSHSAVPSRVITKRRFRFRHLPSSE